MLRDNNAVDVDRIEIFLNYVREIIASDDEIIYNYIISWIAYFIQHPRRKIRNVLVLIGKQGVGNTIFTDIIAKLYEEYANNNKLKDKVLIVINDLNDQHMTVESMMNKFENCVGEKIATIDERRIDPNPMDNISAFIFTTTDKHPIWIDGAWRRDLVVEVSDRMKDNTDYFNNISNSLTNEFYESLFKYFKTYNIEGFNPNAVPDTKIKTHIIKSNDYNFTFYMNENRDKFYPNGTFTSCLDVFKSYREFCKIKGVRYKSGLVSEILPGWCDYKLQYDQNSGELCRFYVLKDKYVDEES